MSAFVTHSLMKVTHSKSFSPNDTVKLKLSLLSPSSFIQSWYWHCQSANSVKITFVFQLALNEIYNLQDEKKQEMKEL